MVDYRAPGFTVRPRTRSTLAVFVPALLLAPAARGQGPPAGSPAAAVPEAAPGRSPRSAAPPPSETVPTPPALAREAPVPAARPPAFTPSREADAHLDRVVLVPTAGVHPEGTVTLSSYELVLLQAGVSLSDSTQVALTATPPLGEDGIFLTDLSLKHAFRRAGLVRVAALGSVSGLVGFEEGEGFFGRVGGVVQLCLEEECRSSVSYANNLALLGSSLLLLHGVGVVWRAAGWLAVLTEVDAVVPVGRDVGEVHGLALLVAGRLPFRTWALDLGVGRALDQRRADAALPWVAFTYRFLP